MRTSIGRAVINKNNFNVCVCLGENAVETAFEVWFDVLIRDNNGNEWICFVGTLNLLHMTELIIVVIIVIKYTMC